MSLLRLLAVGKSLIGLKSAPTPYKMTEENLLPKFGDATVQPKFEIEPVTKRPSLVLPAVLTTTTSAVPSAPPPRKSTLLFAALARRSAQKSARKLVQAELSLGQIRVVRNDLQDSDLEVVATKKRQPKSKPALEGKALAASGAEV